MWGRSLNSIQCLRLPPFPSPLSTPLSMFDFILIHFLHLRSFHRRCPPSLFSLSSLPPSSSLPSTFRLLPLLHVFLCPRSFTPFYFLFPSSIPSCSLPPSF